MTDKFKDSDFYGARRDASMVGWWLLNEGAGTTINDLSPNANTGTLTAGSGAWTEDSPHTRNSYNFSSSSISCGADASLSSLGPKTYTAWIKLSSLPVDATIISKTTAASLRDRWSCSSSGSRMLLRRMFSGSGYGAWASADNSIVQNRWLFVAVAYDHSSASNDPVFYVNGIVSPTTETVTPSGAPQELASEPLLIGSTPSALNTFTGKMCDVRIYNRILSADEIQSMYIACSSNPRFQTVNNVAITEPASQATLGLASGSTHNTVGAYTGTLTYTATTNNTMPSGSTGIQGMTVSATPATTGAITLAHGTTQAQRVWTITPTGDCTLNFTGGVAGQVVDILITTSGTTSQTITFGTNTINAGTLMTGVADNKKIRVGFICKDGTTWWEMGRTIAM